MKKVHLLLLLVFFLPIPSFAQEEIKKEETILEKFQNLKNNDHIHLQFDTRLDYDFGWDKSGLNENKFNAHTFKVVLYGNITDKLSYRFRHRLNRTNEPDNSNFAKATDVAYLEYKLSNSFALRVGKMTAQYGTFEYDYNPADVYLSSMSNSELPAYVPGVNLEYKVANQAFNFQIINPGSTEFATPKYKNKAIAALALWNGDFFNGVLKTRYGFAMFQHDGNSTYNWLTLGTQINVQKFTAELDMFKGKRRIDFDNVFGSSFGVGEQLAHDMSLVANLKYKFGQLESQLKFVWDERKDKEIDSKYHSKKAQLLLQYYPVKEGIMKNMSFHFAYIYGYTNYYGQFKAYKSTEETSNVILGLRWPINVF